MRKVKEIIAAWAVPVLIAVSVFCIFRFVLILGYVPSGSMEPTLKSGSLVLGLRIYSEPEVEDIVIFHHEGTPMVKRIAAAGGDVIEHKGEMITVPEGCYYMLGDNSLDSFDSRFWEDSFVPEEVIVALVLPLSS